MSDTKESRWVDLVEAAAHFDRSERTIRRWIKRGQLSAKRTGGRVLVEIVTAESDKSDTSDTVAELSDKVAKLSDKLSDTEARLQAVENDRVRLAERSEQAIAERDYLRQALAAALSKIPQIEAPAGDEKPPRRWWQFWK